MTTDAVEGRKARSNRDRRMHKQIRWFVSQSDDSMYPQYFSVRINCAFRSDIISPLGMSACRRIEATASPSSDPLRFLRDEVSCPTETLPMSSLRNEDDISIRMEEGFRCWTAKRKAALVHTALATAHFTRASFSRTDG